MTGAVATVQDPRELALLKAVGLDRVAPEQQELALHIASRYDLDLMLKHLVMIEGRPYITRDALLHIAHRSGVLDGIETTEPELVEGFWRATCSVYRKDMSRPFTYGGRYPEKGHNAKFAPEMAIKVAESMALRRAFDVAAPTQDERWDVPEVPATPPPAPTTLAQRVAEKAAEVATLEQPEAVHDYEEAIAAVPVAEGQETLPLHQQVRGILAEPAPKHGPLSAPAFHDVMSRNQVAMDYIKTVRGEMFPSAKTTGELSDEQRGALADEILSGG